MQVKFEHTIADSSADLQLLAIWRKFDYSVQVCVCVSVCLSAMHVLKQPTFQACGLLQRKLSLWVEYNDILPFDGPLYPHPLHLAWQNDATLREFPYVGSQVNSKLLHSQLTSNTHHAHNVTTT